MCMLDGQCVLLLRSRQGVSLHGDVSKPQVEATERCWPQSGERTATAAGAFAGVGGNQPCHASYAVGPNVALARAFRTADGAWSAANRVALCPCPLDNRTRRSGGRLRARWRSRGSSSRWAPRWDDSGFAGNVKAGGVRWRVRCVAG